VLPRELNRMDGTRTTAASGPDTIGVSSWPGTPEVVSNGIVRTAKIWAEVLLDIDHQR
jgi:hypothetical protein